jgi:hypothetical protein
MARWWSVVMSDATVAIWDSELLWPQDLPSAEVIDLSRVEVMGSWVHDWLRSHPEQAVTGAQPLIRKQLVRAGVPVVWCDHPRKPASGGISAGERAMLLGD